MIRKSEISQKKNLLKFVVILYISTAVCLVDVIDLPYLSSFYTCGEPLLCAEALISPDKPKVISNLDI